MFERKRRGRTALPLLDRDWRHKGALHERTAGRVYGHYEERMVEAWKDRVPRDETLANILDEDTMPSERDWYVASSVIQWLATNIGSAMLEHAGFRFDFKAHRKWMIARAERGVPVCKWCGERLDPDVERHDSICSIDCEYAPEPYQRRNRCVVCAKPAVDGHCTCDRCIRCGKPKADGRSRGTCFCDSATDGAAERFKLIELK